MRWESIIGQDRAVKQLRSALERDHVHHAYLLAGPAGTGKELIARTFAQAANCEDANVAARPCEKCEHCRAIERGNFHDVQLVMPQCELIGRGFASKADLEGAPSKEIRVDEIRALSKRLSLAALRGRRKIALVLPADAMNERAQNTLLKTLEEPPSATTFLLISENPDALLPTIRSRCARVQLGPIPERFLAGRLVRDGVAPAEASERAARAQGSFSRALEEKQGGRRELLQDVEKALAASDERPSLDLAEILASVAPRWRSPSRCRPGRAISWWRRPARPTRFWSCAICGRSPMRLRGGPRLRCCSARLRFVPRSSRRWSRTATAGCSWSGCS